MLFDFLDFALCFDFLSLLETSLGILTLVNDLFVLVGRHFFWFYVYGFLETHTNILDFYEIDRFSSLVAGNPVWHAPYPLWHQKYCNSY